MRSRTAVFAIIAFILIATASAVLTVRMTARTIDETAAVQAAEAPDIARLYTAKYGSLALAAPEIVEHVSRSGLRVALLDLKSGSWYGSRGFHPGHRAPRRTEAFADSGEGPPGPAGGRHRSDWVAVMIASLAGQTAHRARIPGGLIVIVPEPDRILAVLRTVGAALGLVLVCSGALLWLYVRSVRREAMRPLLQTTLALRDLARRDFSPRTIVAGDASAYDDLAQAYNAAVEAVSSAFAERRAAESEMQRFIADAGHELRTPLTIVMGYLDIIEGGALADPGVARRITAGMRTEAVRMRRLIEKLIILARMETPSDIDMRTNIDIVTLAQRVIEALEPLTSVPIDVAGVPFAHVYANEDDIAEALTNIIENGLKYAPGSPIAITIARTNDRIVITIADRGPGMSSEEARNAFERFYRGEGRGEVSGSGLGLAIAKRGIERARGTIRLQSAPGAGTTFTIELPEMPIAVADPRTSRLTPH